MGLTLKGLGSKIKSSATKFVKSQPARLANVKNVLAAPFTGGKVTANTGNKLVNSVLSAAANNPLKTAFVGGTVANIPKAVKLVKTVSKAKKAVSASKVATKTGLLDLNELGRPAASTAPVQPGGGLLTKTASTGGLLTSPVSKSSGSSTSSPKKRKKTSTRKRSTRKSTRKGSRKPSKRRSSRKRSYGTAKQYARKGGKSVRYTKNGQPYIILADGRARFVKGSRRKSR